MLLALLLNSSFLVRAVFDYSRVVYAVRMHVASETVQYGALKHLMNLKEHACTPLQALRTPCTVAQ